MENSIEKHALSKDLSSYSSFYKTQTSFSHDKSEVKEIKTMNSERVKAENINFRPEQGNGFVGNNSSENAGDTENSTSSDMNKNSNDAERMNNSSLKDDSIQQYHHDTQAENRKITPGVKEENDSLRLNNGSSMNDIQKSETEKAGGKQNQSDNTELEQNATKNIEIQETAAGQTETEIIQTNKHDNPIVEAVPETTVDARHEANTKQALASDDVTRAKWSDQFKNLDQSKDHDGRDKETKVSDDNVGTFSESCGADDKENGVNGTANYNQVTTLTGQTDTRGCEKNDKTSEPTADHEQMSDKTERMPDSDITEKTTSADESVEVQVREKQEAVEEKAIPDKREILDNTATLNTSSPNQNFEQQVTTPNESSFTGIGKDEEVRNQDSVADENIDNLPNSKWPSDEKLLPKETDTHFQNSSSNPSTHNKRDGSEGGRKGNEEEKSLVLTTPRGEIAMDPTETEILEKQIPDSIYTDKTEERKQEGILKSDKPHEEVVISQEDSEPSSNAREIKKGNENRSFVKSPSSVENDNTPYDKQSENSDERQKNELHNNRQESGDKSWALTLESQREGDDVGDKYAKYDNNNPESEDSTKSPRNLVTTYDNLYFTGRLPSILSRHDTSQSLDTKDRKTDGTEKIDEEEENVKKEQSSDVLKTDKQAYETMTDSKNKQSMNDVNINTSGETNKRKIPTPSRKIQDIIKEMNVPTHNIYDLSRETPISPKSTVMRSKSATVAYGTPKSKNADGVSGVIEGNLLKKHNQNDKFETVNMTVEDLNFVTTRVIETTYENDHRSKFDDMPHMKQISEYVHENLKQEDNALTETLAGEITPENTSKAEKVQHLKQEKRDNIETDIATVNDTLFRQIKQTTLKHSLENPSGIKFVKTPEECNEEKEQLKNTKTHSFQQTPEQLEDRPVQRSSSENDLKAIIASAKMVISDGTETTVGFDTSNTSELTLHGDCVSLKKRKAISRSVASQNVWGTPTISEQQETLASLICSNCLQVNSDIHTAGYCTICQQYLCGTCVTVHRVDKETRRHEIVPSYCKNELAINKYVPATGYCVDCSMFLCMRCVVQHTGFRAYRHHNIIQSSFVSKPKDRQTDADEFLDTVQNKIDLNERKASSKDNRERKRKQKLLVDLDNSSPYSFPFQHVPESLYPGPHKKLGPSYTKNPKWEHSSIPNLPYLVHPKPVPDGAFHAAGHPRPRFIYTRPKTGFDAMAVKLKVLKSRYKMKDEAKSHRRKEHAVFTARPAKARDVNFPDLKSAKSHTTREMSVKHTVGYTTSSVKKEVEFINEHCLSFPFPRGEKRTHILAMTVLLNGKLVVLDKNNNNIKLFNKGFHCVAALQFQNRLVDICASNLCQTDVYAATPKHIYEISVIKGMELTRKFKVEIKRIEGIVCWKYGIAIVSKKTNITWELRLLDYRGNLKSKLEVFNPLTLDIGSSQLQHITSSREGKCISIADTRNSCIITVDVTTRVVVHESMLEEGKSPTYVTADGEGSHSLYVACENKVFQISRKGKVVGVLIDKAKENGEVGCIVYNKLNDRLYVKTGKDTVSVYQVYF